MHNYAEPLWVTVSPHVETMATLSLFLSLAHAVKVRFVEGFESSSIVN